MKIQVKQIIPQQISSFEIHSLPVDDSLTVLGAKEPKTLLPLEVSKKRLVLPGSVPSQKSISQDKKIDPKFIIIEKEFLRLYQSAQTACYQQPRGPALQELYFKTAPLYFALSTAQQRKHAETWVDFSLGAGAELLSGGFDAYGVLGQAQFERGERLKTAVNKLLDTKGVSSACSARALLDFTLRGQIDIGKHLEEVVASPSERPAKTVAGAVVALYRLENFEKNASIRKRYGDLFEKIWTWQDNEVTHATMTYLATMIHETEIADKAFDVLEKSETIDEVCWMTIACDSVHPHLAKKSFEKLIAKLPKDDFEKPSEDLISSIARIAVNPGPFSVAAKKQLDAIQKTGHDFSDDGIYDWAMSLNKIKPQVLPDVKTALELLHQPADDKIPDAFFPATRNFLDLEDSTPLTVFDCVEHWGWHQLPDGVQYLDALKVVGLSDDFQYKRARKAMLVGIDYLLWPKQSLIEEQNISVADREMVLFFSNCLKQATPNTPDFNEACGVLTSIAKKPNILGEIALESLTRYGFPHKNHAQPLISQAWFLSSENPLPFPAVLNTLVFEYFGSLAEVSWDDLLKKQERIACYARAIS